MAEPALAAMAHYRDIAHELHARVVHVHEDHAGSLVLRRIGFGDRHADAERRPVGGGRKPLVAIDYPVIPVGYRRGAHQDGIGARIPGFGHEETAAGVAAGQGFEIGCFLLVGAMLEQEFAVAGVRRLATERVMSGGCAAQHFGEESEGDET